MSSGNDWGNFASDRTPDSRRGGGGPSYSEAYQQPPHSPPGGSGGRVILWVFGIIGLLSTVAALACCGVGYFGIRTVRTELAKQFQQQVGNSPEIAEHVGNIETMDLSFQAMGDPANSGKMVFNLRGSEGSAQLAIDPSKAEASPGSAFVLILEDGQRIPLTGVRSAGDEAVVTEPAGPTEPGDAPTSDDAPTETIVPSDADETSPETSVESPAEVLR
ncbi:MAG: hypothetical protein EA381_10760 [Planctomycetaceae bacterium]|nr:MAG: hypothetical protein EA381_10760 [Planctomycetaceae bacterium]